MANFISRFILVWTCVQFAKVADRGQEAARWPAGGGHQVAGAECRLDRDQTPD